MTVTFTQLLRCRRSRAISLLLAIMALFICSSLAFAVPLQHGRKFSEEMRAKVEKEGIENYFVSEKLDGIRGYWDGKRLLTRQGYPIKAPVWFTEHLGEKALDGELWLGRNQFEAASQVVRNESSEDPRWHEMKFMIFDLPHETGDFKHRVALMKSYIPTLPAHVEMIPQETFTTLEALDIYLDRVDALGGEGLMLHKKNAKYQPYRRVSHLLKVKKVHDADAVVIEIIEGKGKYRGKMGALLVELENGVRFKIGTGFSDQERDNPPQVGDLITFKYNGFTKNNIPRFARFWRIRTPAKEK